MGQHVDQKVKHRLHQKSRSMRSHVGAGALVHRLPRNEARVRPAPRHDALQGLRRGIPVITRELLPTRIRPVLEEVLD